MYLVLRFQNTLLTPLRILYCALFLLIVTLLFNPQIQLSMDAWLQSHGNLVWMVKMSVLLMLAICGFKRLALAVAILAIALNALGFSLAASTSCVVIVAVLLLFTLFAEIGKLIAIDRYYQNKRFYDFLGVVTSFSLVVALV